MTVGFVVGLAAEGRLAARFGGAVRVGGGSAAGAALAATLLVDDGVGALVSFGLAGGLDPALRPGDLVVPTAVLSDGALLAADAGLAARFGGMTGHVLLAGDAVVADAAAKRALFAATGTQAVDLESGAVARIAATHRLPFVAVRAICDPAELSLPPAAIVALDPEGGIGVMTVVRSVVRRPGQVGALMRLARGAAAARRALMRLAAGV